MPRRLVTPLPMGAGVHTNLLFLSTYNVKGTGTVKAVGRLAEWLGTGLVALVVLVAAFMLAGPSFGYETHPVLSGSMEPTLGVGGVIVTALTSVDQVKVGDIVTLSAGSSLVTHRVIHLARDGREVIVTTQGDANNTPDPVVAHLSGGTVPKTILYLPYVGFAASALRTSVAFLGLVLIPGLALVVLLVRDIVSGPKQRTSP